MEQFELLKCKEELHKQQYEGKCNVQMCTDCCDSNCVHKCTGNQMELN